MTEICYECGESVKFGSGKFVNRIPSCDTPEIRKRNGAEFPEGDYLCAECEQEFEKYEIRCPKCGSFADLQENGQITCQLGCSA
jgi:transposase-like protein